MAIKINMQIYLIENLINNKKYVGMTTKSINCRFREHKTKSTQNLKTDSQMIHKAMQKYGVDNFSIKSLEICENHNDLIKAEKKWIVDQNSYCKNGYGYNMTLGGEGTFGHKLSNTSKEKLRSFRLGKKHTNKTKQKMSINRKGKKPSEEHCKHLSEAQMGKKNHRYGKTFTKEQRASRSKLLSGENNPFYGKCHTKETKKLLSEKNKGKYTGNKNPAARKCIINGRLYDTCEELRNCENIKVSKFYTLIKNGTIKYANN